MNTLDERILIPAPPNVVWEHISDLTKNPTWQVDCTTISFLTTFHKGQGVRWRYSGKNRHDYVVQVTAWYEGLGYEYTFVDGVSYRENKGRIRLQEIPEGTIVQWTFSYELGGALGGLRDAIGHKRNLNNILIDSLKKLWLYMKHIDRGNVVREPKSLMRDAPDVEARAQYKPRHPSAVDQPAATVNPIINEPPISDEDTRPRPVVKVDFAPPQSEPDKEMKPLSDDVASPKTPDIMPTAELLKPSGENEPDFLTSVRATQDLVPSISKEEAPETRPSGVENTDVLPLTDPVPGKIVPTPQTQPEAVPDKVGVDTSKVSVFELFGLPKPSETQEMRVVTSTSLPIVIDKPIVISTPTESHRRGIRILLRRKRVKIRRL